MYVNIKSVNILFINKYKSVKIKTDLGMYLDEFWLGFLKLCSPITLIKIK